MNSSKNIPNSTPGSPPPLPLENPDQSNPSKEQPTKSKKRQ